MIVPFVIPEEIEIGDFKSKDFNPDGFDISKYGKFILDDKSLNLSKKDFSLEDLTNRILIYHKGGSFNINQILEGKLSGRTIALGDSISILIKLNENTLEMFTEGKHIFKIESDLITGFEINFELDENNINIRFDPNNT